MTHHEGRTAGQIDELTLPGLLARSAARVPHRVAVSGPPGAGGVSYLELSRRADDWAAALARHGTKTDDRVAVCLPRGAEALAAAWGCWRLGAVFVPVDPAYPDHRVRLLLADSGAGVVVCGPPDAARLRGSGAVLTPDAVPAHAAAPVPERGPGPERPAYVLYTSGSTGRPKGVVVSHRALAHYVRHARLRYGGGSGVSPWHSTLSFDLTVTSVWVPLTAGGEVRVLPDDGPFSGLEALAGLLAGEEPIGLLKLTPTLLEALNQWFAPGERTAPIACVVAGGERLYAAHAAPWLARADRVFNEYGPTETTVGVTYAPVTAAELADGRNRAEPLPIGRPFPRASVHLLDEHDRPGAEGEICVSGPQLADGYLNLPEQSAARFGYVDALPGVRLYRTGDLGRRDPRGTLRFVGRKDGQLKHHGHRIEPAEIESAARSLPGVARCAAVAHVSGQLVAFVTRQDSAAGAALSEAGLRAGLAARLPAYLVPDRLSLVADLPVNEHGKIDRAALSDGS